MDCSDSTAVNVVLMEASSESNECLPDLGGLITSRLEQAAMRFVDDSTLRRGRSDAHVFETRNPYDHKRIRTPLSPRCWKYWPSAVPDAATSRTRRWQGCESKPYPACRDIDSRFLDASLHLLVVWSYAYGRRLHHDRRFDTALAIKTSQPMYLRRSNQC